MRGGRHQGPGKTSRSVVGAVLAGTLQNLRDVDLPPYRTAPDVRALRNTIGHERFRACVDHGASMSYEALITWLLATLEAINSALPADPTTERQSAETATG